MRKSSNGKSNDVFYIVYNTKKNQKKDIYQKKTQTSKNLDFKIGVRKRYLPTSIHVHV